MTCVCKRDGCSIKPTGDSLDARLLILLAHDQLGTWTQELDAELAHVVIALRGGPDDVSNLVRDVQALGLKRAIEKLLAHHPEAKHLVDQSTALLFLDIDGVLNTVQSYQRDDYFTRPVEPELMARLNRILRATAAKVVVSSSWRILPNHREILQSAGLEAEIVGATCSISDSMYPSAGRAGEILTWIETESPSAPTYVVALDDDADVAPLGEHFVWTNIHIGLTDTNVERAIHVLTKMPWLSSYAKIKASITCLTNNVGPRFDNLRYIGKRR